MNWKIADLVMDVPKDVYTSSVDEKTGLEVKRSDDSGARDYARPQYRECSYFTDNIFNFIDTIQRPDVIMPDGSTDGTDTVQFAAARAWEVGNVFLLHFVLYLLFQG